MSENSEKNTKITPVERTDGRKVTLSQNASKHQQTGQNTRPRADLRCAKNLAVPKRRFVPHSPSINGAPGYPVTFLLLLVVEMITHHGMGYDLVAGAKDAATGSDVSLGILNRETETLPAE